MAVSSRDKFTRRKRRARYALRQRSKGKLRLSVFRSGQNIYAQVINDAEGVTITQASTLDKELKSLKSKSNKDAAAEVGKLIGKRAVAAGVDQVVFDRGGYLFHGRVKAVADGAREAGLKF